MPAAFTRDAAYGRATAASTRNDARTACYGIMWPRLGHCPCAARRGKSFSGSTSFQGWPSGAHGLAEADSGSADTAGLEAFAATERTCLAQCLPPTEHADPAVRQVPATQCDHWTDVGLSISTKTGTRDDLLIYGANVRLHRGYPYYMLKFVDSSI